MQAMMMRRLLLIMLGAVSTSAQLLITPLADAKARSAARARLSSVPLLSSAVVTDESPTDSAMNSFNFTLADPTLCDPNVKQHAGYFQLGSSNKKYFFWFFESRSKPSSDPTVMWLTGGPGCSSQMALFTENGPCRVARDGITTENNPYSWNSNANALWIDQPPGTGFSTTTKGEYDDDENGVGKDMYTFLQEFFKKFPEYNRDFFVFGESFAGHYVPAVTHAVFEGNKALAKGAVKIDLKGFAVGNGLTWPEIQNQFYPQMAYDSGSAPRAVNKSTYETMMAAVPQCNAYLEKCNEGKNDDDCLNAYEYCNEKLVSPYGATGLNVYDMREKCKVPPLCYDFSQVTKFLNSPSVQKALGVDHKWEACNFDVNALFQKDFEKNYHMDIPDQLEAGIRVLIYAGDTDYICNWLGNKAWTLALPWSGKTAFNNAGDDLWHGPDGKEAGKLRQSGNFSFLQVFEAGHMVPLDQPAAALHMLNSFMADTLRPGHQEIVV